MSPVTWLVQSLGLTGILAVAAFGWHLYDRNQAYQAGQRDERLVWQERQARAAATRQAERDAAQTKIDSAERDYLARETAAAIKISELEKALEEDQTSSPAAGCGPAVSRRLRDALDAIGRD
ncbi:UNVERIFIED_ORG: hypothetical protein LHK14_18095 [Roseateles sp. XES5]|nr:hypothetical protein [Roseateles sp. XES5]